MANPKKNILSGWMTSLQKVKNLPYDSVTNFSLLGWIMDKILKHRKSEKQIEMQLEE